jgi:hypothetical protein
VTRDRTGSRAAWDVLTVAPFGLTSPDGPPPPPFQPQKEPPPPPPFDPVEPEEPEEPAYGRWTLAEPMRHQPR